MWTLRFYLIPLTECVLEGKWLHFPWNQPVTADVLRVPENDRLFVDNWLVYKENQSRSDFMPESSDLCLPDHPPVVSVAAGMFLCLCPVTEAVLPFGPWNNNPTAINGPKLFTLSCENCSGRAVLTPTFVNAITQKWGRVGVSNWSYGSRISTFICYYAFSKNQFYSVKLLQAQTSADFLVSDSFL